jgi:hypothetical protein
MISAVYYSVILALEDQLAWYVSRQEPIDVESTAEHLLDVLPPCTLLTLLTAFIIA